MDTIETIVQQLLMKQRVRLKTLEESNLTTTATTATATATTTPTIAKSSIPNDLFSMRTISSTSNVNKNLNLNNDSTLIKRQQQQIKTHQIFTSLSSGQIMDAQTLTKKSTSSSSSSPSAAMLNQSDTNNELIDINGNSGGLQMGNVSNSLTVCLLL